MATFTYDGSEYTSKGTENYTRGELLTKTALEWFLRFDRGIDRRKVKVELLTLSSISVSPGGSIHPHTLWFCRTGNVCDHIEEDTVRAALRDFIKARCSESNNQEWLVR